MLASALGAKIAKQVPITQPQSCRVPAIQDLFGDEEEIVDDIEIDPGTYQGGKKEAKEIEKKKINDKKRALMKRDQQILNTSADILSHVFSDVESTPCVTKTTRPARSGFQQLAGALWSSRHPMSSPHQKKQRGKILL